MHLKQASAFFFAGTMIAIGLIGLIGGGFAPIWRPVPETFPAREALAYLSTFVSLAAGVGLLVKRTAAVSALVLLVLLVAWTILFKVPFIFRQPLVEVSYQSNGENAVLIAGAWVLYAELATSPRHLASALGQRIAYVLYGLALIAFGLSHFFYLNMTAPLVPSWLPGPIFWAYLTGVVYLATGVAIVTGIAQRWGAVVSAIQITLISVLVWGPMVLTGNLSPMNWQETIVSWALSAAAWVVAASYEGRPWSGYFGKRTTDLPAELPVTR